MAGPYPAGTKCIITRTAPLPAAIPLGTVVTVMERACPGSDMAGHATWPRGECVYQEIDVPHPEVSGFLWHPCDWMRPLDEDTDMEDLLIASIYKQAARGPVRITEPVGNPEE